MRYPSNSGVLWKVVFAFLVIIDTEQTAQIRWNTTGLRCLCLQFHSSRIPTVGHLSSVTMYNPASIFLTDPAWRSRIFPTVPMLSVTGRPRGYAGVRRISFGMTIRPRSSMRLTMPVAFIYCSSTLCVRNHIAIVCKQWGIMRIEGNKADGSLQIAHCDPHMRITGCIYEVSRLHRLTSSTFTDTIILSNCKRDYRK